MNLLRPEKPAWAGPYHGGVTQSLLSTFQTCPFQFYLYAYCGLEETKALEPNLIWGDILHKGLEHLVAGDSIDTATAKMLVYQNKEYPTAPRTYQFSTRNMLKCYPLHKLQSWGGIDTEQHIEQEIELSAKHYCPITKLLLTQTFPVKLRGKVDLVAKDRTKFGDHKGKGKHAPHIDSLREEINQDLQMNLYSYCLGHIEHWYYDVIRIPEAMPRTPTQKVSETPEQWADRIFFTHSDMMNGFPICKAPGLWMYQINHFQPKEENIYYFETTIRPLIHKLQMWWEYVTHPDFDPEDPTFYNAIFYRAPVRNFNPTSTYSFKCRYHSYLIGKEPIENLRQVKSFYPELEEQKCPSKPQ